MATKEDSEAFRALSAENAALRHTLRQARVFVSAYSASETSPPMGRDAARVLLGQIDAALEK